MNGIEIPPHIQPHVHLNTVRQRQWWTASGVSAVLCGGGCLVDSLQLAGTGLTTFFIAGVIAVAHRVGNDHIFNELDRHNH